MSMASNQALITGIARIYIAPLSTAEPTPTAAPPAAWLDLGDTIDGQTWSGGQTINEFPTDRSFGPRKVSRSDETMMIGTSLVEQTLENLRHAFNNNAIVTVAAATGVKGTKRMALARGPVVYQHALLLRGPSAYVEGEQAQIWLPMAYLSNEFSTSFTKDGLSSFPVEFTRVWDSSQPAGYEGGAIWAVSAKAL